MLVPWLENHFCISFAAPCQFQRLNHPKQRANTTRLYPLPLQSMHCGELDAKPIDNVNPILVSKLVQNFAEYSLTKGIKKI